MSNSTLIAPKTPVLGLYSTLNAQRIRRLVHQTKLIPTLVAPNRTDLHPFERPNCTAPCPLARYTHLAVVRASDDDHDLASRVSFFQVADRLGRLAEGISSLDHGHDFAGFQQLFEKR
jgi:hypothetical protein